MPDSPLALSYAPRPSPRRRWIRRILLLGFVIGVAIAAIKWGPAGARQAALLYWQRKCLTYSPSPDQVVYEQDPAGTPALANSGGEYTPLALRGYGSGKPVIAAAHVPRCATEYISRGPATFGSAGAVLFMHERKTETGVSYLLIVRSHFDPYANPMFLVGYDIDTLVFAPSTWRTPPDNRTGGFAIDVLTSPHLIPPNIKIYAGQADPTDASHFTIRYELDGKTHVVDGYLRDQWKGFATVQFAIRKSSVMQKRETCQAAVE